MKTRKVSICMIPDGAMCALASAIQFTDGIMSREFLLWNTVSPSLPLTDARCVATLIKWETRGLSGETRNRQMSQNEAVQQTADTRRKVIEVSWTSAFVLSSATKSIPTSASAVWHTAARWDSRRKTDIPRKVENFPAKTGTSIDNLGNVIIYLEFVSFCKIWNTLNFLINFSNKRYNIFN